MNVTNNLRSIYYNSEVVPNLCSYEEFVKMVQEVKKVDAPSGMGLEAKVDAIRRFAESIHNANGFAAKIIPQIIDTKSDAAKISQLSSLAKDGCVDNIKSLLDRCFRSPRADYVKTALSIAMKVAAANGRVDAFDCLLESSIFQSLQRLSQEETKPVYTRGLAARQQENQNNNIAAAEQAIQEIFFAVSKECIESNSGKCLSLLCQKGQIAARRVFQNEYSGNSLIKKSLGTPHFESIYSLLESIQETKSFSMIQGYNLEKMRKMHEAALESKEPPKILQAPIALLPEAHPAPEQVLVPARQSPELTTLTEALAELRDGTTEIIAPQIESTRGISEPEQVLIPARQSPELDSLTEALAALRADSILLPKRSASAPIPMQQLLYAKDLFSEFRPKSPTL